MSKITLRKEALSDLFLKVDTLMGVSDI
jgi:hypothetical protein